MLDDGIIEAISADTKTEASFGLLQGDEVATDFVVELRILIFELWVDIDGAAELGIGEDFFDTERVSRDIGER